jgi:ribosomal-protein-alanine N-acetyltransferase
MTQEEALFTIQPMTAADAGAIAAWHYDGPYAFYDLAADADDLAELLDPGNWGQVLFSVYGQAQDLVGYFEFVPDGDTIALGLGMRPDCTGRGLGAAFVRAGLDFAQARFAPRRFRLGVAAFNQRAIRVYERLGFRSMRTYQNATNGGTYEFLEMERDADQVALLHGGRE